METHNSLDPFLAGLDPRDQSILLSHIDSCVLKLARSVNPDTSQQDKEELEKEVFTEFLQIFPLFMKRMNQIEAFGRVMDLCDLLGVQPGVRVNRVEKYEAAGKFAPLKNVLKVSEQLQRDLRERFKK